MPAKQLVFREDARKAREEADAMHAAIILCHSSNLGMAAATLGINERVLRDMRDAYDFHWKPPYPQQHWVRPVPLVVQQCYEYGRTLLGFVRHPLPPGIELGQLPPPSESRPSSPIIRPPGL